MGKQPLIYLAVDSADMAIADVILAHLRHTGYKCIDITDVPVVLDPVTDLKGMLSEVDVIIVIDSDNFRRPTPNHELRLAQQANKPLIVVSLHQKVDEARSTWRVRLFDFTHPYRRNWQYLIDTIIEVTIEATTPDDLGFLF